MAISSLGIGSGLDLNGILTSLLQVEQQPLLAMQRKEVSFQARLSAIGTLKGSLSSLQGAANSMRAIAQSPTDKFTTLKSSVGDSALVSATTSSGATAANYTLENITLAKAHQIRQSENTLNIPASGTGKLEIKLGTSGTPMSINVVGGATVNQIADSINQAKGDVTASVINAGGSEGKVLVLSAKNAGSDNTISVSVTEGSGWSGFEYDHGGTTGDWVQQQEARTASVDINGLTITSNSNTITNAIAGVSISLLKDSTTGTSLSVSEDRSSSITSALNNFIKAYNTAASTMKELGAYNPETKVAGTLQGDGALRNAQSQVRNLVQTGLGGTGDYQRLSDIGVAIQADGSLKLDSAKLTKAINSDFASVAAVVDKVGKAFNDGLTSIVGASGSLNGVADSTNRMIKSLQDRQEALLSRLEQTKARYIKQFTALDGMLSSMNQTSSWLSQQLDGLPGAYSGKS